MSINHSCLYHSTDYRLQSFDIVHRPLALNANSGEDCHCIWVQRTQLCLQEQLMSSTLLFTDDHGVAMERREILITILWNSTAQRHGKKERSWYTHCHSVSLCFPKRVSATALSSFLLSSSSLPWHSIAFRMPQHLSSHCTCIRDRKPTLNRCLFRTAWLISRAPIRCDLKTGSQFGLGLFEIEIRVRVVRQA